MRVDNPPSDAMCRTSGQPRIPVDLAAASVESLWVTRPGHDPDRLRQGPGGAAPANIGAVLFAKWAWEGIRDGSITVTFRRWKRPQAVAGRPYRTPAGRIEVTAVDLVAPEEITDRDARASGYASAAALLADLRATPDVPIHRIRFRYLDEPDPRNELAADAALDDEARAALDARLDRLDRASRHGPWTRQVLELIRDRPAVRAGDLADQLGRERLELKVDVRKLKALGLTRSLPVGYELSPRGQAYLDGRPT